MIALDILGFFLAMGLGFAGFVLLVGASVAILAKFDSYMSKKG